MSVDDHIRALGESQHGVVSWEQVRGLGLTRARLQRRLARGDWELATPRVLALSGAPRSDLQRALVAVLDAGPGAVLSHHSAAALWELPGFRLHDLHVTRPRDGSRRPGTIAIIHTCRIVHQDHITVHDDIPVTTPARTVFDLAGVVHPWRVRRTLETAWSKRLLDGVRIAAILDDLGTRGRTGTTVMRELVAERGRDYVPPESGLESRFNDILVRDGQAPLRRQVALGNQHTWLGRVDFFDPVARLVVQIDSERYHSSLIDQRTDDAQTAALEAAGFVVERFTDFEVWYCADEVVRRVRAARRRHPRTGA